MKFIKMPIGIPLLELSAGYQRPQIGQLAQSFLIHLVAENSCQFEIMFFSYIKKMELKKFVVESSHHVN